MKYGSFRNIFLFLYLLFSSFTAFGQQNASQIPWYFRNPPSSEGIIFGIGSGNSLEKAMSAARLDIAGQLEVRIANTLVITNSEMKSGNTTIESTDVESVTTQHLDSTMENAQRIYYTEYNGEHFVLLGYDTTDNIDSFQSMIHTVTAERKKIRQTTTISSLLLPGTGQFVNQRDVAGGIFLTSAVLLSAATIYSFISSNIAYNQSFDATRITEQDYYYEKANQLFITGIFASVLLAVNAIVSGIDNYRSFQ